MVLVFTILVRIVFELLAGILVFYLSNITTLSLSYFHIPRGVGFLLLMPGEPLLLSRSLFISIMSKELAFIGEVNDVSLFVSEISEV
jgi:hypothetical protein